LPFSQLQRCIDTTEGFGCTASLKEVPNAGHGWLTMLLDILTFANWFDRTLLQVAASDVAN
jgi:hypothetical protein